MRFTTNPEERHMAWQAKIDSRVGNSINRKEARHLLYHDWNRARRWRRKAARAQGVLTGRYGR